MGAVWPTCALLQPGATLFEACCSDHIQPFDEDDDLWEDEETHCVARVTRARWARWAWAPHGHQPCLSRAVAPRAGGKGCSDRGSPPRFGGPHASESCRKDGPERRGQGGEESSEADGDGARAGALRAAVRKEGPRVGDSEGR